MRSSPLYVLLQYVSTMAYDYYQLAYI